MHFLFVSGINAYQCHIINFLLTSLARYVQRNIGPPSFCTNLALPAWSVQKDGNNFPKSCISSLVDFVKLMVYLCMVNLRCLWLGWVQMILIFLLWGMNSLKRDGILTHFNFLLGKKIILSEVSNLE